MAAGAVFGVEVGADSVRVAVLGDELAVLDHVQLRYPRGTLDPYAALSPVRNRVLSIAERDETDLLAAQKFLDHQPPPA